jgi:hypothetical protein
LSRKRRQKEDSLYKFHARARTETKVNVRTARVCVYIHICIYIYIAEGKEIILQRPFANNSRIVNNRIPPGRCGEAQGLTPNAEYLLVRLCCSLFRNTSDFGRGGFLGLRITRASSRMSSSRSLESLDTDNCLCTRS